MAKVCDEGADDDVESPAITWSFLVNGNLKRIKKRYIISSIWKFMHRIFLQVRAK